MSEIVILMERYSNAKTDIQVLKTVHKSLDFELDVLDVSTTIIRSMERAKQELQQLEDQLNTYGNLET